MTRPAVEVDAVLRRVAAEWQQTVDAIESPMFLLDEYDRTLRLNRAARDFVGGSYQSLLGRPLSELGSGPLWHELVAVGRQARSGAGAAYRVVEEGPAAQIWRVNGYPMACGDPADARVLVTAVNVTQVVRLEESLRRAEAMAAMGALVGAVAHQARGPLFGLSATLDALVERLTGHGDFDRHLTVMRKQVTRLTTLLQELLDYARPAALERVSLDPQVVLTLALQAAIELAASRGVRVRLARGEPVPPVWADRGRLTDALENLLVNAIQHSPEGGTVSIGVTREWDRSRDWAVFAVEDEGPGFSPGDLPRLFEPFYTRRTGGTGLGLAIVQRIAQQHEGNIAAANRPDGGAVMRLRLPLARETER